MSSPVVIDDATDRHVATVLGEAVPGVTAVHVASQAANDATSNRTRCLTRRGVSLRQEGVSR